VFPQFTWLFCFNKCQLPLKAKWRSYGYSAGNINALKTNEKTLPETATINDNCFWELNLYTGKLNWSDGMCQLLGLQKPYTPTLAQLMQYYGPEQNIRAAFNRAIHQGIPFQLQIPSLTAHQKLILIYTTGIPVYDDYGKCIAIKGTLQNEMQPESMAVPFMNTSEKIESQQMMFDNFARVVSHNLRSHTSNLQMVLESVERKTSCSDMQEFIRNIKTISNNLNQTVGYLNTLTKI
jgi:hypothetical protein